MVTNQFVAKTVFLFPGVGAQSHGMFTEFRRKRKFQLALEEVSDVVLFDLQKIIFEDDGDRLKDVKVAQLSLLAATVGVANVLRSSCALLPDYMMGHSLGQYSALCAAGVLDLSTVAAAILARAEAVGECAKRYPDGDMCWVLHLPSSFIVEEVNKARQEGINIYVSALDSFDQTTLSGSMADIRRFAPRIEAKGGLFFPLNIGGPFHSPLMQPAADELCERLEDILYSKNTAVSNTSKVICNVTAQPIDDLKAALLKHLVEPVRWVNSLINCSKLGVTRYIEISPKRVLTYLVERAQLPMLALCEPEELYEYIESNQGQLEKTAVFTRYCLQQFFSQRLPKIKDAAAVQQLVVLRKQVNELMQVSTPDTDTQKKLYEKTQCWLSLVSGYSESIDSLALLRLQAMYNFCVTTND